MGFYITIKMALMLCENTGTPYYYGKNLEKIYGYPIVVIPEQYKQFISGKNAIYRAYMVSEDRYDDSTDAILDNFPTWKKVKETYPDAEEKYEWTESDHNLLKEAMVWLSFGQPVQFMVKWG